MLHPSIKFNGVLRNERTHVKHNLLGQHNAECQYDRSAVKTSYKYYTVLSYTLKTDWMTDTAFSCSQADWLCDDYTIKVSAASDSTKSEDVFL